MKMKCLYSKISRAAAAIAAAVFLFCMLPSCTAPQKNTPRHTADGFARDYAEGNYQKMLTGYALDPEFSALMSESIMKDVWEQNLLAFCGPFVSVDLVNVVYDKTADTYTYPFVFAYQTAFMMVGVDAENTVFSFVLLGFENTQERSFPEGLLSEEVSFGDPAFPSKGIFVRPKAKENLACCIIVADSGSLQLGRYGLTGPNSVYYDIALGLANKGIAVLLYDLRAYTYGAALGENFSVKDEYLDDMLYAISFAKNQASVGEGKVILLGHGIGAYMCALLGYYAEVDAAGYILLAANSSSIEDLYTKQFETLAKLDGTVTDVEKAGIAEAETTAKRIQSLTQENAGAYEASELLGKAPSYWLSIKPFDAPLTFAATPKPLLFCYAQYDYKVPLSEMLPFKEALSDRADVRFEEMKGLNHHFMPSSKIEGQQSYYSPAKVSQSLIDAAAGFALQATM